MEKVMEKPKISFVIPCFRSENTIEKVVKEVIDVVKKLDYESEIVLVNDNSPDNVWEKISVLANQYRIIGINLARNFGQANAIAAGYRYATGEYIVVMDDDGQSPILNLDIMMNTLIEGKYDVVFGTCPKANESLFRRIGSRVNGLMSNIMFGKPLKEKIVNFYVMNRFVVEEISNYNFPYTYITGLIFRATQRIGYCPVAHRERLSGKSGYSLRKLLSHWADGFTSFSIRPLRIADYVGVLSACLGFFFAVVTIVNKLTQHSAEVGWSSLMSVILIVGGLILLVLGVIGEYLGRIYICINKSPQYVIREKIGVDSTKEKE